MTAWAVITDDWLPTAANINALPPPVRDYLHALETNCDPAGTTQELAVLRDQVRQLSAALDDATAVTPEREERGYQAAVVRQQRKSFNADPRGMVRVILEAARPNQE